MQGFESEIAKAMHDFVSEVALLAQRSALESLQRALGQGSAVRIKPAARGRGGDRRDREQIDKLAESVHAFVARHPGLRIEQINKELETTTKELALPIRHLIASGAIKTKGKKRSTTYYAAAR
jgi:hypothetical protein